MADYIPKVITVLHKLAAKIMSYINCYHNIDSQLSFMKSAFKQHQILLTHMQLL